MKTTRIYNQYTNQVNDEERVLQLIEDAPLYINQISAKLNIERHRVGQIVNELFEALLIDKRRVGNGMLVSHKPKIEWMNNEY